MFEVLKARLKTLLGNRYVEFPEADARWVTALKESAPLERERKRFIKEISDPATRYQIEYLGNYYRSYKPGIDDVRLAEQSGFRSVVEIGGGPSYIAREASEKLRFCVDFVENPEHIKDGITLIRGDICEDDIVAQISQAIMPRWQEVQTPGRAGGLVVLSYCLDRVSDQQKAIHNFVQTIDLFEGGRGLITVCLPAVPTSPGSGMHYNHGTWITTGPDPIAQFQQVRAAVENELVKARMTFEGGGLTTHYGVSLVDGYEELPCYVLWFSNGSKRTLCAPDISHGWSENHGAITRDATEPWEK